MIDYILYYCSKGGEIMDFNELLKLTAEEYGTTPAEVEKEMKPLYDNEDKDIVIDCEKLEYIASSGLRILLGILKKAKSHGHTVTLKGLNDDIKNVFKMTGFINLFNFEWILVTVIDDLGAKLNLAV